MNHAARTAVIAVLCGALGVLLGARIAATTPNPDLAKMEALAQRAQTCEQKFTRITVLFEPPAVTLNANGLPITLGSAALGSAPAWMIPAEVSPRRIAPPGAVLTGYRYEILDYSAGANHVIYGPLDVPASQPGEHFRFGQPLAP